MLIRTYIDNSSAYTTTMRTPYSEILCADIRVRTY